MHIRLIRHATPLALPIIATIAAAAPIAAQVKAGPRIAVQFISDRIEEGNQPSGWGGVFALGVQHRPWLSWVAAVDVARMHYGSGAPAAPCDPFATVPCRGNAENRTTLGANLAVELQSPTHRPVRPFIAAGPALRFRTGGESVHNNMSRTWLTPQIEGGARLAAGGAIWSASLRWRRVDNVNRDYSELGVIVGIRPSRP